MKSYQLIGFRTLNYLSYAFRITIFVNIFWTIINLLPIQPLDGGRLLSIFLEGFFGIKGLKISLFISIILSAVIGIFFFAYQATLAGIIFLFLTFESYLAWRNSLPLTEKDQDETAQNLLKKQNKIYALAAKTRLLTNWKRFAALLKEE